MGAGASIPEGIPNEYNEFNDELKEQYQKKYEKLIAEGKSIKDVLILLQEPQLKVKEIELIALLDECELAAKINKTPLVIDNSSDNKVDTFFGYRSFPVIDGKKMGVDKSLKKIPVIDILEESRKKLALALKVGMPLIIAMTKSVTDFKNTFNDDKARELYELPADVSCLPLELFNNAGKNLVLDEHLEAIIRKGKYY